MAVGLWDCEERRYLQLQAWPLADSTYISYDVALWYISLKAYALVELSALNQIKFSCGLHPTREPYFAEHVFSCIAVEILVRGETERIIKRNSAQVRLRRYQEARRD